MLIDLKKEIDEGSLLAHVYLNAFGDNSKKDDLFGQILEKYRKNPVMDIKLVVEGIEVPVFESLNNFWEQFDYQVKKHAKELLAEEINKIDEVVEPLKEKINEANRLIMAKFNLPSDE